MGRPPAVVIVARHGARLDAADTQWHLTSPTPYDPPLTYGGWKQSQALGARIASIIHSQAAGSQSSGVLREGSEMNDDGNSEAHPNVRSPTRGRQRKHKVVIHTSPFLRCIQTSVAISAGMAQYQGSAKVNTQTSPGKHSMHSGLHHVRTLDHARSPRLSAIPEPEAARTLGQSGRHADRALQARTLLRIDAFLGEWLSPDYFDNITPPPESKLMVAGAKADLLRRGEAVDAVNPSTRIASSQGNFPGGWGSNATTKNEVKATIADTSLADLSSLSQAMPKLGRANSHHIGSSAQRSGPTVSNSAQTKPLRENTSYIPPIPSYAISPSQPIPQGYVAHAREACVRADFKWDSLRSPLEWGNGGNFGEEWSAMHKRFRRGLHEMISWYSGHDPNALVRTLSEGLRDDQPPEAFDDEETDTVLVLVTHGAGCNALIGALTNQPVLIDVGMASLTMATRKSIDYRRVASPSSKNYPTSPSRRRLSTIDLGISDDYDVKLIASTDHLRAGSQFLQGTQSQRTATMPSREKSPYRYERPGFADTDHSNSGSIYEDSQIRNGSIELNGTTPSKGRPDIVKSSATEPQPSSGGGGLWSKPVPAELKVIVQTDTKFPRSSAGPEVPSQVPQLDGLIEPSLSLLHEQTNRSTTNGKTVDGKRAKSSSENDRQGRSIAPSGLWGAPPQALRTERDMGAKRRWTLSQAA